MYYTKKGQETCTFEEVRQLSTIADNIRQIISERCLKQSSVARKAGYTVVQFSAILCGRKTIKADDIIRIAKALEVTPNELFGVKEVRND